MSEIITRLKTWEKCLKQEVKEQEKLKKRYKGCECYNTIQKEIHYNNIRRETIKEVIKMLEVEE